jgi:hypothetical protein
MPQSNETFGKHVNAANELRFIDREAYSVASDQAANVVRLLEEAMTPFAHALMVAYNQVDKPYYFPYWSRSPQSSLKYHETISFDKMLENGVLPKSPTLMKLVEKKVKEAYTYIYKRWMEKNGEKLVQSLGAIGSDLPKNFVGLSALLGREPSLARFRESLVEAEESFLRTKSFSFEVIINYVYVEGGGAYLWVVGSMSGLYREELELFDFSVEAQSPREAIKLFQSRMAREVKQMM